MARTSKANATVVNTTDRDGAGKVLGVTFTVRGSGPEGEDQSVYFDLTKVSAENIENFLETGVKTRIGSAANIDRDPETGASATPATKFNQIRRVADHFHTGTTVWTLERQGGGPTGPTGPRMDPVIIKALSEVLGKSTDDIKALVVKQSQAKGVTAMAYLATAATAPKVAEVVKRLRQEQMGSGEDLLEGLMEAA